MLSKEVLPIQSEIENLDKWERDLLQRVEVCTSLLIENLLTPGKLLFATDGGASIDRGSFSWVIARDPGTILAYNQGTARGAPMQSLRAEAYGSLSLHSFVALFIRCYGLEDQIVADLEWHCDCQALLQRLSNYKSEPWTHWSQKLGPDDDIIKMINLQRSKLPPIKALHVKAHQDDKKNYYKLSFQARLNVIADDLCTCMLNEIIGYNKPPQHTIPIPLAVAYWKQGDMIQTSQERRQLREAIPLYNLEEYTIAKVVGMTRRKYHDISWAAFKTARNTTDETMRKFITKLIYGLLPTTQREHMMKMNESSTCLCCKKEPETTDHLFQCESREETRRAFLEAIVDHLNATNTKATIIKAIRTTMRIFLDFPIPGEPTSDEVGLAMHLLVGFIPVQLLHMQEPDNYTAGEQWALKLIRFFWQEARKMWLLRNETIHGPTGQSEKERSETIRVVEKLLDNKYDMSDADRTNLLPNDRLDLLKKPTAHLKAWCKNQGAAIAQAVRNYEKRATEGVRPITDFFKSKDTTSGREETDRKTNTRVEPDQTTIVEGSEESNPKTAIGRPHKGTTTTPTESITKTTPTNARSRKTEDEPTAYPS
jgi:hypothetical protein